MDRSARFGWTPETLDIILEILSKGNSVELKRERDNLVIVEIKRKVKIKTPAIG